MMIATIALKVGIPQDQAGDMRIQVIHPRLATLATRRVIQRGLLREAVTVPGRRLRRAVILALAVASVQLEDAVIRSMVHNERFLPPRHQRPRIGIGFLRLLPLLLIYPGVLGGS
jgi:hypothetical protein